LKGNIIIKNKLNNFDQVKAKNLLKEAGFKDENKDGMFDIKPIVINVANGSQESIKIAENIKNHLMEIGLPIKVEPDEFQTIISRVHSGKYQLSIGRWVGGNQDPRFLHDLFASSEIPNDQKYSRNRSRYKNKKVDDLLNSAMQELDTSKAKSFYQDAQDIISEDMPLLPLWYPSYLIITNQKVYGDFSNSKRDFSFVKDLIKLP
jgi:ABC-type transport system substrate-binding protein